MNEQFYMKMHMADTPQRQNAKQFGAGVARNITIYRNSKLMRADTPQRQNAKQFGAGVAQNNYYAAYQMHVKKCESCLHERTVTK
ncbi:MAG: hypothetical protein Q4P22_06195 [Eubacteriales bacterium]|nr:hypothetical protein [Eubacteriales bacterium]